MKNITSIVCALMVLMSVNAAPAGATRELGKASQIELLKAPRLLQFVATQPSKRAPQADAELTSGTYYTAEGSIYAVRGESNYEDATSYMPSVQVTVEGDNVAITGLSYYIPNGTISGKKEGNVITFASGQSLGIVQGYGIELFLLGTEDGETICDITFEWDPEAGTLTAGTLLAECGSATSLQPYAFWQIAIFSATEPEEPDTVALPENLELKEYAMSYTDYQKNPGSGSVYIGIDGNDVYMVGFSTYLPNAAVKGTKDGNTITFAPDQYLGVVSGMRDFFVTGAVLVYDEVQDTYTAGSDVYALISGQYIDRYASDLVLKGVVEKAVMPANPAITGLVEDKTYGYYITFNVPNVDINGDGLVASKLFYEIFTDIDGTVEPLTFTPATHTYLNVDELTIIPFGFSESYDFYDSSIYLNDLYSADWDKLGIKSIYYGGDAENATEIQWFIIDKGDAVENISAAAKAVKVIENGQLLIRQGEKTYNSNGVEVK